MTLHHNYFDATVQRKPKLWHGLVHPYTYYLRDWGWYGMGVEDGGQLYSQANIFEAGDSTCALSTSSSGREEPGGTPGSLGDLLIYDAVTAATTPRVCSRSRSTTPSRWSRPTSGCVTAS